MASLTDKFTRVSDSDTGRPVIAQLVSPGKAIGATSININDSTNWTTTTKIHFVIYNTTIVVGKTIKDTTTQTEWIGTLAGTVISNLTLTGGTDQQYLAGAYVELTSTAKYAKDLYDGLVTNGVHNADGTLKSGAISTSAQITDGIVTTTKIVDGAVTASKFDTGAITLGYTQITTNFATSSTTNVQVTGLTSTVTIPAGGRRVKLTVYCPQNSLNATGDIWISIWDGTVGSGTQLQESHIVISSANFTLTQLAMAIVTPAAGSKTYNVGMRVNANTGTIACSATIPTFIHVEAA